MRGQALPDVVYQRFENPPLRAMLGQLQFPPILRLEKGVEAVADFQDAIRATFPGFAVDHQVQVIIPPIGDPEAKASRVATYRFTNEASTWQAVVTPTALSLEAAAGGLYSSYSEFADLFKLLWGAAIEHFRPTKITQQGLRYVDQIEGERTAAEWAEWIRPELLGAMAGDVLGPHLHQSVSQLLYQYDDGRLVFRHGITPAGPQNAMGYLLDFDSIYSAPLEPDDIDTVMARFNESHEVLYRFFRWCVTDRALTEFRPCQ